MDAPKLYLIDTQTQPLQPVVESQTSPFSCNICHKTYTRPDHLARHVRSHTQEKPFSCSVCGKRFARAYACSLFFPKILTEQGPSDLLKRHNANHEESPDGSKRRRLNQPQPRIAQACIPCAASKLRCSGDEPCKRCDKKSLECRYSRPKLQSTQSDDAVGYNQTRTAATHEEWSPRPDFAYNSAGNQYHDGGLMRTTIPSTGENHHVAPVRPLTQVSVSSLQQLDTDGFPSSMYNSHNPVDHYESSFAEFLRDVMMPDQVSAQQTVNTNGLSKHFPNFDLLDLAVDESMAFVNENYNSRQASDAHESRIELSRHDLQQRAQGSSGHTSPSGVAGIRLGTQAFKESVWTYAPSKNHHVWADSSNMFMPLENLVAKTKHHGPTPCGNLTPAVRDRILATVLAETANSIVPDVVSSFPSAELLTNLIHQFLVRHERNEDAWIHTPTFNPNQQDPEFLMSVIAAGASVSEIPQIRNLGYAFQESARRSVTEQIERDNRTIRHLRPLQTYALQLDVGLWSGDRRRMELSESHALIMVTMIRRGGFFRRSSIKDPIPDDNDTPEIVETNWRRWVERESFKRLVSHLLIRDAQTSITLILPPTVSPSEVLVELPASGDLWRATTSEEWKRLCLLKYNGVRGATPNLKAATEDHSLVSNFLGVIDVALTNLLVLSSLWSLSWQYRELMRFNIGDAGGNSSLITKSLYQEILQALQRFKLCSSDWMPEPQPLAVILHERILLNLHVSLEDVQSFAGKAGEDEARRAYPVLVSWAQSRESRQAIWYAGQIFKAAKESPNQTLLDFSAVSLYHASLVFWAYAIITTQSTPASRANPQEIQNQQIVFVDDQDSPLVQRFIVLGTGRPALDTSTDPAIRNIIPIDDPKAIMAAMTDLLKRNNCGDAEKDDELSPLVLNLRGLMRSLGNAADGIMISQPQGSGLGLTTSH